MIKLASDNAGVTDLVAAIQHPAPTTPDFILREWIRTEFNLPTALRGRCSATFLRIWQGDYVAAKVAEGKFNHEGKDWIVHWQSVPTVVRASEKVACSFRVYEGQNYVVIKAWKADEK